MKKTFMLISICCIFISLCSCSTSEKTVPYFPGTISDNEYVSEYFNIRFEVPIGYSIATEEELNKMSGDETNDTTYELIVKDDKNNPCLMIATSNLQNKYISEAEYLDDIKENLSNNKNTVFSFNNEYTNTTIAGINYLCLHVTANASVENDYYVRINENIVSFLITTYNNSTKQQISELLNELKPLK